jgi:transcription antitermination factor NusG
MTTGAPPSGSFVPCGCRYAPGIEWLCVSTGFGQERTSDRSIRALGLVTWLPEYAIKDRLRLLFPGYMFAQADIALDPWRSIYRQPGVVTVLGTRYERPTVVAPELLAELWRDCLPNGVLVPRDLDAAAPLAPILPGAAVTLRGGPFAELTGVCEKSDRDRVAILLTIMGRDVRVSVARAGVQ